MHDLSLYVLEMIENSLRAGASRVAVRVWIEPPRDELSIAVEDDGPGLEVSPEQATDPFFTTKSGKKTGLGLPLFREAAEAAGGHLTMRRSAELGGLAIEAVMRLSHVDRPPLGDMVQTVAVMAATNPEASLSLEVGAGPDTCLAPGVELAAGAPAAARCVAILATADAHPVDPAAPEAGATLQRARRPVAGAGADTTTDPTPAVTDTVDLRQLTKERGMTEVLQQCSCEEATEEELLARLDEVIAGYKDKPGALIPVLQLAQGIFGYLPEVALKHIALKLGKPYSEVAGVVGFYSFFSTVPRGKHVIRVCLGTACYVRGGVNVLDALKKDLAIDVGGTTEDRQFSLEVGRCFGACGLAPVIMIDDDVHHRVKPKRVGAILDQYADDAAAAERSA